MRGYFDALPYEIGVRLSGWSQSLAAFTKIAFRFVYDDRGGFSVQYHQFLQ
jgi:hypothetical protein